MCMHSCSWLWNIQVSCQGFYFLNYLFILLGGGACGKKGFLFWKPRLHILKESFEEVCGVMFTVIGDGHGDSSSNPERGCLYFT